MKALSTLPLVALVAVGPLCASPNPPLPSSPAEVVISETDDGTTVPVEAGARVTMRLPAVPGTGHAWTLVRGAPELLEQLGESTFEPLGDGEGAPRVGGPAHQVFRFAAKGAGAADLELVYRAPGAVEATRRFRVRVVIR